MVASRPNYNLHLSEQHAQPGPLLSVVVPVYNEEACLDALHRRLTDVLQQITDHYEILFINDGSVDDSLPILRNLAQGDPHVGYHSFSRNFGHEAATSLGLEKARGQAVVLIDADLQDPPELIATLVERWREGYQLVYAQRSSRAGEHWLTKLTSYGFYRVFHRLAKVEIPVDTGDFRLMDRAVVDAFLQLRERNRFVRGMISWTGFRQITVPFERDVRLGGTSKYHFFNRLKLALDAICSMSTVPLRLITFLGLLVTVMSFAIGFWVAYQRVVLDLDIPGYALLTVGQFLLGGTTLLTLGMVGEYVGRIYIEVQQRPVYLLAESHHPDVEHTAQPIRQAG